MSKNGVGTGIWNSRKQDAFNHMIILNYLMFGVHIHRSELLLANMKITGFIRCIFWLEI